MLRPKKRKQQTPQPAIVYQCKDCANSYDWHSKALDGHLILCRCKYKTVLHLHERSTVRALHQAFCWAGGLIFIYPRHVIVWTPLAKQSLDIENQPKLMQRH